jgi:hypothetical protein
VLLDGFITPNPAVLDAAGCGQRFKQCMGKISGCLKTDEGNILRDDKCVLGDLRKPRCWAGMLFRWMEVVRGLTLGVVIQHPHAATQCVQWLVQCKDYTSQGSRRARRAVLHDACTVSVAFCGSTERHALNHVVEQHTCCACIAKVQRSLSTVCCAGPGGRAALQRTCGSPAK